MYDILNTHRVEEFIPSAAESFGDAAANAPDDNGVDLWANKQLPNRMLLLISVTAVGEGGTLDLIVQDSPDKTTWDADFITIPQITATGLYLVVVDDPNRYVRINHDVGTADITFGVTALTFENQRLPVTQSGTALVGVYGDGRSGKVAAV
jgi:hypothetical protein